MKRKMKRKMLTLDPKVDSLVSDIDGCVANVLEQLQLYVWEKYRFWFTEEIITDFTLEGPLLAAMASSGVKGAPQEFDQMRAELYASVWSVPYWMETARPYFVYWAALRKWRHAGGRLLFATARPPTVVMATQNWLRRWDLISEDKDVVFSFQVSDDTGEVKADTCRKELAAGKNVYFVEDKISAATLSEKHLSRWPKILSRFQPLLIARPWNHLTHANAGDSAVMRLTEEDVASKITGGLG